MMNNGFMIKKITEILEKRANNVLQTHNLTIAQAHVLAILYHTEGHTCSLKELEKHFHVAQSTIAGTVSRLEKKELVVGFTDLDDRRVKMIRLTPMGKIRCLESKQDIRETERLMISNLTAEEAREFNRLLKIVYNTIQ